MANNKNKKNKKQILFEQKTAGAVKKLKNHNEIYIESEKEIFSKLLSTFQIETKPVKHFK